jgi:hypothetical protein
VREYFLKRLEREEPYILSRFSPGSGRRHRTEGRRRTFQGRGTVQRAKVARRGYGKHQARKA